MVNTRSSDAKHEQNVKNETSSDTTGENSRADAPPTQARGLVDQTEALDSLLKAVEKISKTLSDQVDRSASLAGQVARMSKHFEGKQLPESDSNQVETAGESATPHGGCLPKHPAAAMPSVARHFAKPQDYDGSIPWLAFRKQFESIASTHRWNPKESLGELVACLRGPALEIFAHLPAEDREDYGRLMSVLELRFGCGKQEPWFRTQFRRRQRHPGEALPALARDIEKLAFQAYPEAPSDLRDSLACDQFLDAIGDADLQVTVRQSHPACLQDAVTAAVEIEAIRRSVRTVRGESQSSSGFASRHADSSREPSANEEKSQEIEHRLRALEAALRSTQNRRVTNFPRRSKSGSSEEIECWGCGQRGHVRRLCPSNKSASQGSGFAQRSGNEE